jgi:hypothetical protein
MADQLLTTTRQIGTAQLKAGGFTRAGVWRLHETVGFIQLDGPKPPKEPGVYAYAVDGVVRYVGSAQSGLRKRLRHYEIATTKRTAHRVRLEILALIAQGIEVEVFTIVPPAMTTPDGLPIDTVAGLEEGLIRSWRPAWNRRGLGTMA